MRSSQSPKDRTPLVLINYGAEGIRVYHGPLGVIEISVCSHTSQAALELVKCEISRIPGEHVLDTVTYRIDGNYRRSHYLSLGCIGMDFKTFPQTNIIPPEDLIGVKLIRVRDDGDHRDEFMSWLVEHAHDLRMLEIRSHWTDSLEKLCGRLHCLYLKIPTPSDIQHTLENFDRADAHEPPISTSLFFLRIQTDCTRSDLVCEFAVCLLDRLPNVTNFVLNVPEARPYLFTLFCELVLMPKLNSFELRLAKYPRNDEPLVRWSRVLRGWFDFCTISTQREIKLVLSR